MMADREALMRGPISQAVANDDIDTMEVLHDEFVEQLGAVQFRLLDLSDLRPGETMYAQLHDATTAWNFGVLDLLLGLRFRDASSLAAGAELVDDADTLMALARDEWDYLGDGYGLGCD